MIPNALHKPFYTGMQCDPIGNQSSLFFVSPDKVVRPNKRHASSQMIFENEKNDEERGDRGVLLNSSAKRSRTTPCNNTTNGQSRFSNEAMLQQSAKKAYDRHAAMCGIRSPTVLTYPTTEAMDAEQRQHQYSNESSIAALNEKTNIGRVYVPPSKRLQQGQQQQNQQPSGITNIPPPRKLKQFPAPRAL
ncbi:unnamed protein product [Bathycoccus prasinos]